MPIQADKARSAQQSLITTAVTLAESLCWEQESSNDAIRTRDLAGIRFGATQHTMGPPPTHHHPDSAAVAEPMRQWVAEIRAGHRTPTQLGGEEGYPAPDGHCDANDRPATAPPQLPMEALQ